MMVQVAERVTVTGAMASTGQFIRIADPVVFATEDQEAAGRKKADAVLAYLRTVRGLGKTRVTSLDVADALGLPQREVRRIMLSLTQEGVKAA